MPLMRRKKHWLHRLNYLLLLAFVCFALLFSCQKDPVDPGPGFRLTFSQDTVFFDTVFTSLGSTTQSFTVHNTSNQRININSIRLAGGQASFYRINVDGIPGFEVRDMEIAAKDSLYIFLRVTIDPDDQNSPFIVKDSIVFDIGGKFQDVKLVSWGQNANYILADTYIPGFPKFKIVANEFETVTWTAEKPYVIYGYAVVDSNGLLQIERGTNIHFHNNSGLWIYKGGTLKVRGAVDAPVTFQGDRLEQFYADLPGQWDRIWINEGSIDNEIDHAVIRNGFIGLQLETLQQQMGNQLILSNTRIENMTGFGILTRFYNLTAYNNVVVNCGQYLAAFTWGGYYDIRHCTFANYWSYSVRVTPSIVLNNYFVDEDENVYAFEFQGYFGNSIFYGRNVEELLLLGELTAPFNYKFDHCLLQTTLNVSDPDLYPGLILNTNPMFLDYLAGDFSLDTLSPLIDKGNPDVILQSFYDLRRDILENPRPEQAPDLGAYEFMNPEYLIKFANYPSKHEISIPTRRNHTDLIRRPAAGRLPQPN